MKEKQKTGSLRRPKTCSQELPYERFLRFGSECLTEAELLAVIIRTGAPGENAVKVAEQVLNLAGHPREGLLGLYNVTLEELMSVRGIGEVKAVKLKCLAELSKRICSATAKEGITFTSSAQVAGYFMEQLRHRDTECVVLACVDAKGQMICEKQLSHGSVKMALISPREIFMEALRCKAVNILLVHNHPSGDPTPSRTDMKLTENVRELGEKMDIPLLDHIIIGDNRYISFKEESWFYEEAESQR